MDQEQELNQAPAEQAAPEKPAEAAPEAAPEAPARDYGSEVTQLITDFPEVGENYMTEEVFSKLISSDKSLSEAFREYKQEKELSDLRAGIGERDSKITALEKELEAYRQNAEAAKRAPVTAVSDGGSAETFDGDPVIAAIFG